MEKVKPHIDILLIVLVGFFLRFTISITHSYSNDELSAVTRLRFDNFSALIEFGVQKGDMHPAGVQIFMKAWSTIGGTSEAWMRFPFVIFGTLSIWVLFLIGKKWFNRRVGTLAASFLSILYFPIMNAEFARPYSPGLLLTLLVSLFIYKVLFEREKQMKNGLLLGLFFALAMYTHYFAFLTVGTMGLIGLFYLNKENWKFYILSGILAILLYLPHFSVTYYHLNVGGLDWLPPPSPFWLADFLFYAFNSSWLLLTALIVLLLIGAFKGESTTFKKKNFVLVVAWFFGVYGVGHVVSLVATPVLKFPVMLFVFPFFLLLLSLIVSRVPKASLLFPIILILGSSSTILEKKLYGNQHYALFEEVSDKILEWEEKYREENVYKIFNVNNASYLNYYANQQGKTIELDWDLVDFNSDIYIRENLIQRSEKYCAIGYSARITLLQSFESVKEFYPEFVDAMVYENGAIYLFKKGDPEKREVGKLWAEFKPDQKNNKWEYQPEYITKKGYLLHEENIYGPTLKFGLSEIEEVQSTYFKVEVEADLEDIGLLTASISGERNGAVIQHREENFWIGRDLEQMIKTSEEGMGYLAFKMPDFIKKNDQLKISLWNRGGTPIYIKAIRVYLIENNWN